MYVNERYANDEPVGQQKTQSGYIVPNLKVTHIIDEMKDNHFIWRDE